ncbi:MAG: FecR domain-containing protein, partial [Syntrophus sp. (in: bacteria)]
MKKIILILMVLVVAALILPVAVLAAPIGKITALEGKVDMTPAGAKDAVPVAVGVSVNAGDILRAKSKSKAEITFPDGNILRLAENTRVRVTQYQPEEGKKSYVNLFRGKTVAVVDKLKKGANFEVHTP